MNVDEIMESGTSVGSICCQLHVVAYWWVSLSIVTMVIRDHVIVKNPVVRDFCFELFAHVTKFFGYKVLIAMVTKMVKQSCKFS